MSVSLDLCLSLLITACLLILKSPGVSFFSANLLMLICACFCVLVHACACPSVRADLRLHLNVPACVCILIYACSRMLMHTCACLSLLESLNMLNMRNVSMCAGL